MAKRPNEFRLTPRKRWLTLAECPIGMFMSEYGTLCMKTEYSNNEGRIDAFIVSSGEFYWGAEPQTIASQRESQVLPLDLRTVR